MNILCKLGLHKWGEWEIEKNESGFHSPIHGVKECRRCWAKFHRHLSWGGKYYEKQRDYIEKDYFDGNVF